MENRTGYVAGRASGNRRQSIHCTAEQVHANGPAYTGSTDRVSTAQAAQEANARCAEAVATTAVGEQPAVQVAEQKQDLPMELRKFRLDCHLKQFLADMVSGKGEDPISTGIPGLDAALDEGLRPGLYVLGAQPSLGKTTLALQIADHVSACGRDVLFFSLETSAEELIRKSVSRCMYQNYLDDKKNGAGVDRSLLCKSANELTPRRFITYDESTQNLISEAISRYAESQEHLYIYDETTRIGTRDIRERVKLHMADGSPAPLVIIDYTQILASMDVHISGKQHMDDVMLELKDIVLELKAPVLAISSLNRASYDEKITMASFKESGMVEYCSNVMIGLQVTGLGSDKNANRERYAEVRASKVRDVELVILKDKQGNSCQTIPLTFYAANNYFDDPSVETNPPSQGVYRRRAKKASSSIDGEMLSPWTDDDDEFGDIIFD